MARKKASSAKASRSKKTKSTKSNKNKTTTKPLLLAIPREDIKVKVEQLIFDPRNYRLKVDQGNNSPVPWLKSDEKRIQDRCAIKLWDTYKANELYENMRKNGISFQDRLVVAKWPKHGKTSSANQKYIVLEGNRRLRAFQELRKNQATLNKLIIKQLDELKVVEMEYDDLDSLMIEAKSMMAVRHLCGTRQWSLYAQALACKDAFDEHNEAGAAAASRGISTTELKKNLRALSFYDYLQNEYGNELSPSNFSSVKNIVGNTSLKQWMGLDFDATNCELVQSKTKDSKVTVFMRKYVGYQPTGTPKIGDENSIKSDQNIREVGKILAAGKSSIITKWEENGLGHDNALSQSINDASGNWPETGNVYVAKLKDIPADSLYMWSKSDIKLLNDCIEAANKKIKMHRTLMQAEDLKDLKTRARTLGLKTDRLGKNQKKTLIERILNR